MAKILVADDNSNVQKTVALALGDLGVEVVAVNNGDAAVKKLPDVMPDLVLADIFMPVRNGYEVCEYVKKDSRFSHIPVVLLVGAFDPLDEREAHRVGADGILKKPFVPPDPLIAMVKTLLDRTVGDRLVTAAASKPAVSLQSRSGGVAVVDDHDAAPAVSDAAQEEELPQPAERLSFGDGEHPVAFSQLLDAPTLAAPESTAHVENLPSDDQVLTSSRDESLGVPIFWKTEEPEQELNSENLGGEGDDSTEPRSMGWKPDNGILPVHEQSDSHEPQAPLELVLDEKDAVSSQISTVVEASPSLLQDAASQASLHVEASKPADLAANPLEWMASVPPPKDEEAPINLLESGAAIPKPADHVEPKEPENLEPAMELAVPEIAASSVHPIASSPLSPVSEEAAAISQVPSGIGQHIDTQNINIQPSLQAKSHVVEDTARSIPKLDWADLVANLETKGAGSNEKSAKLSATPVDHPATREEISKPNHSLSVPSAKNTEDTARSLPKLDWADLAASLQPRATNSGAEKATPALPVFASDSSASSLNGLSASNSAAAPPSEALANHQENVADIPSASESLAASTLPAGPDPALVEAVVQRVLDKMRPQLMDIITKEFLRPAVQAFVHHEITKR